jgi:hypothetical protein
VRRARPAWPRGNFEDREHEVSTARVLGSTGEQQRQPDQVRKTKQREDRAKQAEINRVKHGRTHAREGWERADRERAEKLLAGKRLEHGREGATVPESAAGESDDS